LANGLSDAEKKVIAYIQQYKKQGYSDEKIKEALIRSKIPQPIIDKCMKAAHLPFSKKKLLVIGIAVLALIAVAVAVLISLTPECERDSDCDSGFACDTGACVEEELECRSDRECGVGEECQRGSCVTVAEEIVEEAVPIVVTPEAACDYDLDCGSGYECDRGDCVYVGSVAVIGPVCGDGDCDAGEDCALDCGCTSDSECEAYGNYSCNDRGACYALPESGGGGGEAATTPSGEEAAVADTQGTSTGTVTTASTCSSDEECSGGYVCDTTLGACYSACSSDAACRGSYYCDTATQACVEKVSCGSSYTCSGAYACDIVTEDCYWYCIDDGECNNGYACSSVSTCLADNDSNKEVDTEQCSEGGLGCVQAYACAADGGCAYDADADGIADADQCAEGGTGCSSGNECSAEDLCERIIIPAVCTDVLPGCADGVDNDGDGSIDLADSDCASDYTGEETTISAEEVSAEEAVTSEPRPECSDGEDNDGDGTIDTLAGTILFFRTYGVVYYTCAEFRDLAGLIETGFNDELCSSTCESIRSSFIDGSSDFTCTFIYPDTGCTSAEDTSEAAISILSGGAQISPGLPGFRAPEEQEGFFDIFLRFVLQR